MGSEHGKYIIQSFENMMIEYYQDLGRMLFS